jgi:hypothetical protein
MVLGIRLVFIQPLATAVLQPHADVGFDRAVGQPHDIDQHVRATQRIDRHVARRLRLDRAWDVEPLQRELTC